MKRIDVVGFGPGGYEYMTVQAIAAMKAADVLVGYTTYIDLIKDIFPDKNFLNTPMTREAERCPDCSGRGKERKAGSSDKQRRQWYLRYGGHHASDCPGFGRGYSGTYYSGSDGGQHGSVHAWRTADE